MPNSEFARALRRLNAEQLKAVQTIEGPVMVLAGPGTGKTQVVAMRVAQILQQTQLGAQNVLALTFTEAGVTALKQRLTTLIGEDAYRVTVATFHGFARQVIETFPYVFAKTQPLTQLGDLERFVLLEEIVAGQALKALQPIRAPRYFLQEISQAIRQCKQEAVTPEILQDLAEQEYRSGQATKLTKVAAAALEAAYQRRLELARVLEAYQTELTARSLYDYEDLILLVTDALQNDVDVRSYFQERYQYLLVDEYQDTNNAQNALVEALADFFTRPNLFVVGDDKQAIYRFQGASVANLLHFQKRYPDIAVISLKENYRSTPEILAVAEKLIGHNQHQITQYLPDVTTALTSTRPSGTTPQVVMLDSLLAEQAFIRETLQKLKADGVAWSEMAVLWRTNAQARQLRQFLLKNDIPVAASDERNLFGQPEITLFLQVLTAVADPLNKGLRLVYGLLVSLLFGLPYQLGPFYSTPELALCIGNLLVFILNPKSRLTLTLVKKNHLSPTVSEFTFTPNTNLRFLAGQYLEWTLPHTKPDTRGNRRFFTIASSPTESSIHLGIKLNSPGSSFKHSLDSLMPNTTLTVSQLSGEFTLPKDPHQKLVFIAGGIGITPFRSMLKYLVDTNSVRNIILFYSCASVDDFVYKDIFSEAEQKISLKTYYVLTTPTPQSPSWINLHGRLTPEYIKTAVPDYQERTYYLSGPQAMVDSYKALLLSLGIKHAHIVTDYFPGF
jgi:ferredoxin-NADP reductase